MNGSGGPATVLAALVLGSAGLTGMTGAAAADITCAGLAATVVGTSGDDLLEGTEGADVIAGLGGDDSLAGLGGDDVLCGDFGIDFIDAGEGDDRVYGGRNGLRASEEGPDLNVGDTVMGGPGDDLIDPGYDVRTDRGGGYYPDTISYERSDVGVQVDLATASGTGEGVDVFVLEGQVSLIGSPHADVLLGTPGPDFLTSLSGDDHVDGRAGRDRLDDEGGAEDPGGDDVFIGGLGGDYLAVGGGDDVVRAGPGNDRIEDEGVPDVEAGPGDDLLDIAISPRTTTNRVDAGPGRDRVLIGVENGRRTEARDVVGRIDLRSGTVHVRSRKGRGSGAFDGVESITLPTGRWTVTGTARAETVHAWGIVPSRLVARMGGGRDTVTGTPGSDLLVGGPGRDRAEPGAGQDRCRSIERTPAGDPCEVTEG